MGKEPIIKTDGEQSQDGVDEDQSDKTVWNSDETEEESGFGDSSESNSEEDDGDSSGSEESSDGGQNLVDESKSRKVVAQPHLGTNSSSKRTSNINSTATKKRQTKIRVHHEARQLGNFKFI